MDAHQFPRPPESEHTMSLPTPLHYAHNYGGFPICGVADLPDLPDDFIVHCCLERDRVTCMNCIDVYEERDATPAQIAALASVRDEITKVMDTLEQCVADDLLRIAKLDVVDEELQVTPWWRFVRRHRLNILRTRVLMGEA